MRSVGHGLLIVPVQFLTNCRPAERTGRDRSAAVGLQGEMPVVRARRNGSEALGRGLGGSRARSARSEQNATGAKATCGADAAGGDCALTSFDPDPSASQRHDRTGAPASGAVPTRNVEEERCFSVEDASWRCSGANDLVSVHALDAARYAAGVVPHMRLNAVVKCA